MADSVHEIKKALKLYLLIGALLFIFTGVTVAVATVPALDVGHHGFDVYDMTLGLAIAAFKASLVMLIFMHLNHEKKLVYYFLAMSVVCGIFLMVITAWAFSDPIQYGHGTSKENHTGFYDPSKPPVD